MVHSELKGGSARLMSCCDAFPRYHCVLSALSQQNSELRDTLMLTEFLERVELEESQELDGSPFSLGQVRSDQVFIGLTFN